LKEEAFTMEINVSFKQMSASDVSRDYAQEKSERLKKYFQGKIIVKWSFAVDKLQKIAHCHLLGNNMDYFAESSTEDLRASIDETIDKIEKQVKKHKEIVKDHLHRNGHRLPAVGV
jgi:putative sigma-54 modulation protein